MYQCDAKVFNQSDNISASVSPTSALSLTTSASAVAELTSPGDFVSSSYSTYLSQDASSSMRQSLTLFLTDYYEKRIASIVIQSVLRSCLQSLLRLTFVTPKFSLNNVNDFCWYFVFTSATMTAVQSTVVKFILHLKHCLIIYLHTYSYN